MFDIKKFGGYLSRLRKNSDMTQSELADKLNLTRQAISRYEQGDSFPDVSILVLIADVFGITLDELINGGEPTRGESQILGNIAVGNDNIVPRSISDIVNLAPYLKPSILTSLSLNLSRQGIDISNVVSLAEYLNDESVVKLLENATFDSISDKLLEKIIPFLDGKSKNTIFIKILDGSMDWHMLRILIPYMDYIQTQIEEAVVEGVLPLEALDIMREGNADLRTKRLKDDEF